MGIKEILEKLGVNQEEFKTLRSYLINKSDICFLSGNICYIEEAKEEIKICSIDTNSCTRDSFYSLVLEKENEIWKIAKIS